MHEEVFVTANKTEDSECFSKRCKQYFSTRISTLLISKEELRKIRKKDVCNPFSPLRDLTGRQWNFFLVGLAGWTWDAFDFFAVSLNVSNIAESLGRTTKDITWGITLVLMLRSVGAVIFGLWGDRYGRKWPFIINLVMLIALQIGTGFVTTYKQFLGVRAIFGIAMGGMYGNCAACALDDCPARARGVISGLFQEGYALGYLLVVVFQRAITDTTAKGWRSLFWFSAGPAVLFIVWRMLLPETDAFKNTLRRRELENTGEAKIIKFKNEFIEVMKSHWLTSIYLILMMSGFNFMSHGSQDLYPTLLSEQYEYSSDRSTVTNAVANLGAIAGGFIFGHLSNFFGRRLCVIIACVLGGAMIYPWAFTKGSGINAGAFFLQFGVQGAWGIVPIHVSELAIPEYRSAMVGLSYQLGNLCSSASSTIEATIGERFPLEGRPGIYDYSKVMSIFMGCVFAYLIIIMILGPEKKFSSLNVEDYDYSNEENDITLSKPAFNHTEITNKV